MKNIKCYQKDYPRPQFVRKDWENLNGVWDFAFDDVNEGEQKCWFENFPKQRKILVPFTYETEKSGIEEERRHDNVWYQRQISISKEKLEGHRYILHFEGCDYVTKLWINGQFAGKHKGGYARFSFDVTNLIHVGENIITVKAEDSFDCQQPRGKQRWMKENFGCWYVQTTGIWKTVWAEFVPETCLKQVKITPDLQGKCVNLEIELNAAESGLEQEILLKTEIEFAGIKINTTYIPVTKKQLKFQMNVEKIGENELEWGIRTWSPQNPDLYDVSFSLYRQGEILDEIGSYFGMREIRIDKRLILLNERPLYQKLILDQGYWKESHLTPPNEEALVEDLDKIQKLGYNGVRKHQKTEDERFLYWCDVKGILVWCEAPAAYQFTDKAQVQFVEEWMKIVRQNYNHPSIITWTPFNESWGICDVKTRKDMQHFTEAIYHMTKGIDYMRPVIVNDGWEHTISDIITLHDYEEDGEVFYKRYLTFAEQILKNEVYHNRERAALADGYIYQGQPIIISEYGGIAFDNDKIGWGYGKKVNSEDEFMKRFASITTAVKKLPYICGYCYTQVSDVQQEINGLMDMKRNFKVNPEKIREINERMT